MEYKWIGNYSIKTKMDSDSFIITANKDGLLSLASILTYMANNDELFDGWHMHLDQYSSLETGSVELILEKDNSITQIKVNAEKNE